MNNILGIQHGDISFHPLKEISPKAKELSHNGKFVVAVGEATGHEHRVMGDFKIFQDENGYYLKVKDAKIEHWDSIKQEKAEHDTITLPKGDYIVRHERGFNPFKEEIRRVAD